MFSDIYFQTAYEIPGLVSTLTETTLELSQHFVHTSLAHCTCLETERFTVYCSNSYLKCPSSPKTEQRCWSDRGFSNWMQSHVTKGFENNAAADIVSKSVSLPRMNKCDRHSLPCSWCHDPSPSLKPGIIWKIRKHEGFKYGFL